LQNYSFQCKGAYKEALSCADKIYDADTHRTDNLLMLGALHFQLRNFSESIFYNQQCIRVDPTFAEVNHSIFMHFLM
jgi:protein O-GlcNAc transferase